MSYSLEVAVVETGIAAITMSLEPPIRVRHTVSLPSEIDVKC